MKRINLILIFTFILMSANCQIEPSNSDIENISTTVDSLFIADGVKEAIESYQLLFKHRYKKYMFDIDQLNDLGVDKLKKQEIKEGLKVLQLNCVLFPDSSRVYSKLGHGYYIAEMLERSREAYTIFLEMDDPVKLMDVILIKRLFFVPESFEPPRELVMEEFIIKPIKESHAELDFEAIMNSKEHLTGALGGGWPGDLTLEEDREVLKFHEKEFSDRVGFVYTVMNITETAVLGCVYIYPSKLDDFKAEIGMWVIKEEYDKGLEDTLFKTVNRWLKSSWPFESVIFPGRELSWSEFYQKLGEQDQKYKQ
jgi:hypothetical protein